MRFTKFRLVLLAALLFCSSAFAADNINADNDTLDLLKHEGSTSIAVGSTTTYYTKSFPLPKNRFFGLDILLSSSGTPDVKFELEEGNSRPDTENSSDADEWAVTDTISGGISDTVAHIIEVAPIAAKYGRIKITGQGSNHSSTTVTRLIMGISES